MLRSLIVLVTCVAGGACLAGPPLADLGTFELDPVALLRDGEEVQGDPGLTFVHAQVTYRFATPETRRAFEAEPDRFAVRQGGACPRMGALSGVGKPELWAVHDGALYFCASDGCRTSFGKSPEVMIERDDPMPTPSAADAARGERLLARTLDWMGGRDAVLALRSFRTIDRREVESGGKTYVNVQQATIAPGMEACRRDISWDEDTWTRAFIGDAGYFNDKNERIRLMDADQLGEALRRMAADPVVLIRAFARGACVVEGTGPDDSFGGERVLVHLMGRTSELVVDPEDGRLIAQRFRDWGGSRGVLGGVENRFTRFDEVGGVRFPVAWERWHDGAPDPGGDLPEGRRRVEVNPELEAGFFEAPEG